MIQACYDELSSILVTHPEIKKCFKQSYLDDINGSDSKFYSSEDIEQFICNNFSEVAEQLEQVYVKYYGEEYDIPKNDIIDYFNGCFGFFNICDDEFLEYINSGV